MLYEIITNVKLTFYYSGAAARSVGLSEREKERKAETDPVKRPTLFSASYT